MEIPHIHTTTNVIDVNAGHWHCPTLQLHVMLSGHKKFNVCLCNHYYSSCFSSKVNGPDFVVECKILVQRNSAIARHLHELQLTFFIPNMTWLKYNILIHASIIISSKFKSSFPPNKEHFNTHKLSA